MSAISENEKMNGPFHRTFKCLLFVSYAMSVLLIGGGCNKQDQSVIPSYHEFRDREFNRLELIRENKAAKVQNWLNDQKNLIEKDETIVKLQDFFTGIKTSINGRLDRDQFFQFNNAIERFFVYDLDSFYDLLFIDEKGIVFYSVKLEDDFKTSMIDGPYSDTKLAKIIQGTLLEISYVDFEYYGASDEPAAFYVLPIEQDDRHDGWIAFQLSINHLNKLLTNRSGLGRTGEAYLVNDRHLMLTDSRFINNGMVLSKEIDTEAVRSQKGAAGSKLIDDYRGIPVLSTFQTFQFGNANWRIIVEKDEAEIITEYYRNHSDALFPLLIQSIEKQTEAKLKSAIDLNESRKETKRVDIGELMKSDERKALYTYGLATCTGIVAYIENRDDAYMAHLSPVDDCYNLSENEMALLGDRRTDLVSLMLRRIQFFDIPDCQIGHLRFVIAAPHAYSLRKIIDKLIDQGISISQIKAGIISIASSVSLSCNVHNQSIIGQWNFGSALPSKDIDFESLPNLGDMVKNMTNDMAPSE